jgi:lysine decarboxylase
MDQSSAPLIEALVRYQRRGHTAYTPPGHKHRGVDPRVLDALGVDVFRHDLLSSSGLDDRASSGGYLSDAQDLMAEAVQADGAIFSTCGSSLSIKAMMLAAAGTGTILAGRDAHKSIASGLVLSGQRIRWARPIWDDDLKVAHPPSVEEVTAQLDEDPDIRAVLVTSPTPYGTCADLEALVELCHDRDLPLLVDEAWGAHLPFHPELPTWAMEAGADVAVVSVHKSGGGLEQGSVIAYQGDLIDPAHLSACADLLATTSANVLIYAAMDGWRRYMVEHGRALLSASLDLARRTAERIEEIPGLHVALPDFEAAEASADIDPHVLTVDLSDLGITGYTAADWLRTERRVDMGLSDHRRVCAQLTYADGPDTADTLVAALRALAEADLPEDDGGIVLPSDPSELYLDQVWTPREAFFAGYADVPADEAVGRICAEQITPYPPGIPVALPGERLTRSVIDYLRSGLAAGMVMPDPADATLNTIRVVVE